MEIVVNRDSRKCWSLKIDGKCPLTLGQSIWGGKDSIKEYLLKHHGIDLLTDSRIKRNYIEYQTRKVAAKNGKTYIIKERRQLTNPKTPD